MPPKKLSTSLAVIQDLAESAPTSVLAPLGSEEFVTEKNSPFKDGYSISGEEKVLKEFLDAGGAADDNHPLYDRYIELEDRKDQLHRMQLAFKNRRGAEAVVNDEEYDAMLSLGSLVDEQVDQMTIHTKEAFRMFMGRAREPGTNVAPIIGGKRVAAALKNLWILTGSDNPYADWALLRHEQTISELLKRLAREIKDAEAALEEKKRSGLVYSIVKSSKPQVLNLGYKSPYGYAISSFIVDYDYYIRVQKTLAHKYIRSDEQVRQAIAEVTRFARRVFNETARFDRWLSVSQINGLCRADFIPGAAPESEKRVEFATGVFGVIPSDVYSAKLQPRHSRRRINVTPAERKLLQSVSADLQRKEKDIEQGVAEVEAQAAQGADAS